MNRMITNDSYNKWNFVLRFLTLIDKIIVDNNKYNRLCNHDKKINKYYLKGGLSYE